MMSWGLSLFLIFNTLLYSLWCTGYVYMDLGLCRLPLLFYQTLYHINWLLNLFYYCICHMLCGFCRESQGPIHHVTPKDGCYIEIICINIIPLNP